MTKDVFWKLGICELSQAYRNGAMTPIEVAEAYRARIDRIDPILNCYVAINPALADEAAESADRIAAGAPRSPLEGVPVAVKDNLVTRGMPVSWGSAVFAEQGICSHDELPVSRLREAGAVILGKTNTPEFAVEGYTHNRLYGTTGNAWNPALTPGGSSGGSVSAVAAGLAAAAIGTDGGGSIRRPAGYTGLLGLKPTIGAVPRAGGLPQVLLDFEVVGGLARSAADQRVLHAVLAGEDRADPMSRRRISGQPLPESLRILYVPVLGDNPCDPGILKCCGELADRLRDLGHQVTEDAMPFDLAALNDFWPRFGQIGLAAMRNAIPEMAAKASSPYLDMADMGASVAAPDFYAALDLVRDLRAATSAFFADWNVIMTPSSAAQPWAAAEPFPPEIAGRPVGPRGHAVYTGWVNAAGLPGLNLSAGMDGDGMPVGAQLVGDLFSESMLLDMAASLEADHGGWRFPDWLDDE
ncbi:amidase [Paracoccus methylarcula]|uniref:Amidase n=1 Tax=Paracoccus methylarcula TaxID=72022 RepID=A0A3R7NBS6_9RHOB|nr:amidase [Paracoccus methylarcula]RNF34362.1 amidase [Paracoccus methylarcula]